MDITPQPVATVIIAAQIARDGVAGAWEARFKGRVSPVGYGTTKDQAVALLILAFPLLAVGTPEIEERIDPTLEGR